MMPGTAQYWEDRWWALLQSQVHPRSEQSKQERQLFWARLRHEAGQGIYQEVWERTHIVALTYPDP